VFFVDDILGESMNSSSGGSHWNNFSWTQQQQKEQT